MRKVKKLFIKTFGCQMNEYDSNRIRDLLQDRIGTEVVNAPENADIILLNTCSIREKAEEKLFSDLGRLRPLKKKNPKLIIAVGGCVASQEGKIIIKRAPCVDIVFGPQTLHRLPEMIAKVEQDKTRTIDISFPQIEKFDSLPPPRLEGSSAYVAIMEGCNNFCTYCIVPYTRGEEISRPLRDILNEVNGLVTQGAREIILLGQNVNNYSHEGASLVELVHDIAKIGAVGRIRFMTSHPKSFTKKMIQLFADTPKLANHLHLPAQHGSDLILKAMARGYTADDYRQIIAEIRALRPTISISSDFIVGFPGETDDDFEQLMQFVHDIKFDYSFSFIYSKRPGTPAAKLKDNVALSTKKKRLQILQDTLKHDGYETSKKMVGTTQRILFTEVSKYDKNKIKGQTENYRYVHVEAPKSLIGNFADVIITEALPKSLRAELL